MLNNPKVNKMLEVVLPEIESMYELRLAKKQSLGFRIKSLFFKRNRNVHKVN